MKHRLAVILSCALLMFASGCSSPRQFSDLADTDGVNMVYMSSMMFKLTGSAVSKLTDVDLSGSIDRISGIRVITADTPRGISRSLDVIKYQIKAMHAKPIAETFNGIISTKNLRGVYVTTKPGTTDVYDNVVLVTSSNNKLFALFLEGQLTGEDIAKIGL